MRASVKVGVLAALSVAFLVSGCSASDTEATAPAASRAAAPASPEPATPSPAERNVYVAVGASETVGLGADDPVRQAWPTVLHETALKGWDYVNVGVSGATVSQAMSAQLPAALAADPQLVTVWLNVNDITHQVPPHAYERLLGTLVHQLRRGGETQVLLANTPAVERLPAYRACLPNAPANGTECLVPGVQGVPGPRLVRQVVAGYNAAIGRVAEAEGALLVDVHAESGRRKAAAITSEDGFHPSTWGHRTIARAFAAVADRAVRQVP